MSTQINYLSIDVTIGGHNLSLETDKSMTLADLKSSAADIKTSLTNKIKAGLSFKMEEGRVISVTVKEMLDWVRTQFSKIDAGIADDIKTFIGTAAGQGTDGISIKLWDLSISTKLSFSFCILVALTQEFYNDILPSEVSGPLEGIFTLNSIGFGLSYEKEISTT